MDYIINEEILDWINGNSLPNNNRDTENNFSYDDIGDWDGEEELATQNLNRIMLKLELALEQSADRNVLFTLKKQVWNDWSKDTRILGVDENIIVDYVTQLSSTKPNMFSNAAA